MMAILQKLGSEKIKLPMPMIFSGVQMILYEGEWYVLEARYEDERVYVHLERSLIWECSKAGGGDSSGG